MKAKYHRSEKQKLIDLFNKNEKSLFDLEELSKKLELRDRTLSVYLQELKKKGVIDSISPKMFNNKNKASNSKSFFYGNKKFVEEIKKSPIGTWKI